MRKLLTLKEFEKKKLLKEGCWFTLGLNPKAYLELPSNITGVDKKQIIANGNMEHHLFRFTGKVNKSGPVRLLGQPSGFGLKLKGLVGYENGIENIQTVCKIKYEISGEIEATSITVDEHERLPTELKCGKYWLPREYKKEVSKVCLVGIAHYEGQEVDKTFLALDDDKEYSGTREVRPVISLYGDNIRIAVDETHDGKKANTAYNIVILERAVKTVKIQEEELLSQEEFRARGFLQEGCWFRLHLDSEVNTILEKYDTGYQKEQEVKNKNGETWLFRYTKSLEHDDQITLLGEPTDCQLYLSGRRGSEDGDKAITAFCKAKYSIGVSVQARSITMKEYELLTSSLKYGEYWLPERYKQGFAMGMHCVIGDKAIYVYLFKDKVENGRHKKETGCDCNSARPVISLCGKNVKILISQNHDGAKASTAFDIIVEK